MKILEEKYPLGSIPGQRTAGRYIDEFYYENLKALAEVIVKDMTFLAIVSSSTLEVGTGKSVFVQQTAEAWISLVNELHNMNLPPLNMSNIVFKPKDLITRAFQVPKYSVVIVDEWDDAHYWSELGVSLRTFFRKCRQLNLFIIMIIPNFFQLPISYAISRSVFFVDVRFEGKFERGYFRFFNFDKKRDLYIYGKKTNNYDCVKPNFQGRFGNGYTVDEAEYRRCKVKDLEEAEDKMKSDPTEIRATMIKKIRAKFPNIKSQELADALGVSIRTIQSWTAREQDSEENPNILMQPAGETYTKHLSGNTDNENFDEKDEEII